MKTHLCGDFLLQASQNLWAFARGEISDYKPGERKVISKGFFFDEVKYSYRNKGGEGYLLVSEFMFQRHIELALKPIIYAIEFISRRILGTAAAALTSVTLAPLGSAMNFIHKMANSKTPVITPKSL